MQSEDLKVLFKPKRVGTDTCFLLMSDNHGLLVLHVEVIEEASLQYILNESNVKYRGTVEILDATEFDEIDSVVYIQHMYNPAMELTEKSIKFNEKQEQDTRTESEEEVTEVLTTEEQEVAAERVVLISGYFGIILTEDYESLRVKKALTTEVVLFMLNNMNANYVNEKYCVLDSFLTNYAIDYNRHVSVEQEKISMDRLKERMSGCKVDLSKPLICPMCVDNHFTLFIIQPPTAECASFKAVFYDSVGSILINTLTEAITTVIGAATEEEISIDFETVGTYKQEPGSNDCGAFLIKYVECIMLGTPVSQFIEGQEERKFIANSILNYATEEMKPLFPTIF